MTDAITADMEAAIRRIVEDAIDAAIPRIVAALLAEQARRAEQARGLPEGVSDFDRELARVVETIWRDQGRQPVRTPAVAVRIGYSGFHTLCLLKEAERVGAVASIPGRGSRHSGRWIPVSGAA
jgi:hypothetical protein